MMARWWYDGQVVMVTVLLQAIVTGVNTSQLDLSPRHLEASTGEVVTLSCSPGPGGEEL